MSRYLLTLFGLSLMMLLCSCAMTLPRAAETGNSAKIFALLREGAPVDQRGGFMNETALIIASRHGNLGIVRTLLKAGADINARTKYGDTALTAATYFCHPHVAEFLLQHDAEVNVKNYGYGSTPLMLAVECGDLAIVKALISNGAHVNEKNKRGMTALIPASVKGHTEIVQLLLDASANLEETWEKGGTALYESAQQGHNAIVQTLIAKGANINARLRHNGWTPLMIAVAEGHTTTAVIILESGAEVNISNNKGRTALMFAAWHGDNEITEMLLKYGANPNIIPNDDEGMTALMAATTKGYQEIVKMLLKSGADPNLKDKQGKTALTRANENIGKLLREAGAKD